MMAALGIVVLAATAARFFGALLTRAFGTLLILAGVVGFCFLAEPAGIVAVAAGLGLRSLGRLAFRMRHG